MKKIFILSLFVLISFVCTFSYLYASTQNTAITLEDIKQNHLNKQQSLRYSLSNTVKGKNYLQVMDTVMQEIKDDRALLSTVQINFQRMNLSFLKNRELREALMYLRLSVTIELRGWYGDGIDMYSENPVDISPQSSGRNKCETTTIRVGDYDIASCNVGATSTDVTSRDSYGYIYQWGSDYAGVYGVPSDDVMQLVDSRPCSPRGCEMHYFITVLDLNYTDWTYPQNNNLWGGNYPNVTRPSDEAQIDKRGVCPEGFHIPTQKQWESVVETLGYGNDGQALTQSILRLPFAGYRSKNAVYSDEGVRAAYWTSTPDNERVYTLFFSHRMITTTDTPGMRATAYPVRCFKNF